MTSSKDFPKDFAGTEHYRQKARDAANGTPLYDRDGYICSAGGEYFHDVRALCDHIEGQRNHIEALDKALRISGERRAAAERRVEELEDYINRAMKQLYDGLDMFDHDMRFFSENAIEILGKAAEEEVSTASPERSPRTESSEE